MASLNDQIIYADARMQLIREKLAAGETVLGQYFRGISMRPMLRQGKDSVELAPLKGKLKKYDLPVYRCADGRYVMHRVVKAGEDFYICLGDNTYHYERVLPEQMIAVVCAFSRGKRRICVDARGYRLYCRVWCASFPLRRFLRKCKRCIRKVFR